MKSPRSVSRHTDWADDLGSLVRTKEGSEIRGQEVTGQQAHRLGRRLRVPGQDTGRVRGHEATTEWPEELASLVPLSHLGSSHQTVFRLLPPDSVQTLRLLPPDGVQTLRLLPPDGVQTLRLLPPDGVHQTLGLLPPDGVHQTLRPLPPDVFKLLGPSHLTVLTTP